MNIGLSGQLLSQKRFTNIGTVLQNNVNIEMLANSLDDLPKTIEDRTLSSLGLSTNPSSGQPAALREGLSPAATFSHRVFFLRHDPKLLNAKTPLRQSSTSFTTRISEGRQQEGRGMNGRSLAVSDGVENIHGEANISL